MMSFLPPTTSADTSSQNPQVAVLPVGSFEQHGAHLPLATDTMVACLIAEQVTERCGLFLLPPITISCSHEHHHWPGTVSLRASTLIAVVDDIVQSLKASGVNRILIVNGHGGNYVLSNIVQEASVAGPRLALFPSSADWRRAREAAGMVSDGHDDMHAGELETSLLLHAYPDVVRSNYVNADETASERPHMLTLGLHAYTQSGVVGYPSRATAAKGQLALSALVAAAQEHLAALAG